MRKNRIVLFDGFWDRDGMLHDPGNYLDTETGDIILVRGEQLPSGEWIHNVYDVDVSNERYLRLPTVGPYLRKCFLNKMNIPDDVLKEYGVDKDRAIDPYIICDWEQWQKIYSPYSQSIHCLFEEEMDIESEFYEFAYPEARRMAREWFKEHGIEIVE